MKSPHGLLWIDLVMGIVAGTVFWQQSDDPQSVMGILFQSMFFVSVGAMLKVPGQFEPRSIFYKQQDANFFSDMDICCWQEPSWNANFLD
jgi:hypothetical protein